MSKDEIVIQEKDYVHAQNCFIGEAICGNILIKLTQGVFITGFCKYVGVSDSLTGIIASIPMFVGFLQIVGGIYFQNTTERKKKISFLMLLSRVFLGLGYIIPVFLIKSNSSKWLFILLYTLGYLMVSLIGPAIVSWVFEMCPVNRAEYLSRRERIVMIVLGCIEIPLGYSLDIFKQFQKEGLGFICFGLITIVFGLVNLKILQSIKEKPVKVKETKGNLLSTLKEVIVDKYFQKLVILFAGWNMGIYFGNAYLFVYLLNKLEISYLFITCMGMLSLVTRTLAVKGWAKLIKEKSWSYVAGYGIGIMVIANLLEALIVRRTAYIILPVVYILSGLAWGAVAMTFFNLQVMFIPEEKSTQYVGVFASVNGVSGFIGTLIAAVCIKVLKPYAIDVFGITVANIQMVFLISAVLLGACYLYTKMQIQPLEQKLKDLKLQVKKS